MKPIDLIIQISPLERFLIDLINFFLAVFIYFYHYILLIFINSNKKIISFEFLYNPLIVRVFIVIFLFVLL
jgi:hypothetical protein